MTAARPPRYDLAVIGAGAAGLSVTAVAAQLGLRVALIERHRMGGDCLNTGCVPSKALLAAAHAAEDIRTASRFGIHATPTIDWTAVHDHVHAVIAAIAPSDSVERFTALGAHVILGEARFTGPDTIEVNGQTLCATRIVIAAGARPAAPAIPGLSSLPYLTSETLFESRIKPDHLLILGGGPIGLEMAQSFALLGARVTLIEATRIAAREDPALVAPLRAILAAQGITLIEGTAVAAAEPGPSLVLADGRRITGSHLLVAAGRTPNIERLDLPAAAIQASRAGIATDAGLRSLTNRRVYAAGDIADPAGIGPRAFTHLCSYHAGIVIRRALFRLPARLDYRALPRVTYTAPELAQVGLTEAEARAGGHDPEILSWPLHDNDRAIAERRSEGLIRLVVSRKGRLLGAGILAPHAGEMIGAWTLALARDIPLATMAGLVVPYPTLAEIGKRAAATRFTPRLFAPLTRRLVHLLARLP